MLQHHPVAFAALALIVLTLIAVAGLALYAKRARKPISPFTPFKDLQVQFVEVDGWSIRYHQSGEGPHLLLLHGLGANLYCWRHILGLLGRHFTVTAIDLPGFGQSSALHGAGYGLDHQVPRVTAILDRLKIEKTYVVGNSMGGNIALWLALLHPQRILGISVIAPATSRKLLPLALENLSWLSGPASILVTRQAMAWAHKRTVSKKDLVDQDRVEETYRTYGGRTHAVRSFMLAAESIRDPRLPRALEGLKTKVLILWGSRDKLVSRKVIDELQAALAAAESQIHIGGGHHLQEDEPDWVAGKLVEFFERKA